MGSGFTAAHLKVPLPVGDLDRNRDAEQGSKLLGRLYHVPVIFAAEVVDAAGKRERRIQLLDDLPHKADAAVIVPGKSDGRPLQRGPQKVQRKISPDGQVPAGKIVHPWNAQQNCIGKKIEHPLFSFEFVPPVNVGRGERKRLRQRAVLLRPGIDLIGTERGQLCPCGRSALGHPDRNFYVGTIGFLRVLLAETGIGQRRQMEHGVRLFLLNEPQDVVPRSAGQKAARKGGKFGSAAPLLKHARTYKAARAGNEDFLHGCGYSFLASRAARTFSQRA